MSNRQGKTTAALILFILLVNCLYLGQARAEGIGLPAVRGLAQLAEDSPLDLILTDISKFPKIQAYFTLNGSSLNGYEELSSQNLLVLEDEKPIQKVEVSRVKPGVQFVMAINSDEMFALRDSKGTPRYDALARSIETWAQSLAEKSQNNPNQQPAQEGNSSSSGSDDLSLITVSGAEKTHLSSYAEWLSAFKTEAFASKSSSGKGIEVLTKALEVALDQPPQPGMGKAILFITSPLTIVPKEGQAQNEGGKTTFESIIARAKEQRVHIFVWMVASPGYFTSSAATQLVQLVDQTGGKIFMFSGAEPVPNLDEYLEPLRHNYRVSYDSQIRTRGAHQLTLQLSINNKVYSSTPHSFILNIVPPQPMFVSPPSEIIRTVKQTERKGGILGSEVQPASEFSPQSVELKVLVDFPDGFKRSLTRSSLYVDGQIVAENTAPPFDTFVWDITPYQSNGQHILQVEVVDQLELSNISIETPIWIKIYVPKQDVGSLLAQYGKLIAAFSLLMAAVILLWALVLAGRIHPRTIFIETKKNIRRHKYLDPVTQPVVIKTEPITRPKLTSIALDEKLYPATEKAAAAPKVKEESAMGNAIKHFHLPWQKKEKSQSSPVFLVRLFDIPGKTLSVEDSKPFTLLGKDVIIGSSPKQATLVLEEPSVEAAHTRLVRMEDGVTFWVTDLGSKAGTWVNYSPIPAQGTRLQVGDILHVGSAGFRVTCLNTQGPLRRSVVSRPLVKK